MHEHLDHLDCLAVRYIKAEFTLQYLLARCEVRLPLIWLL